jgi:GNAT superfamily N-acetyltransferase
MQIRELTLKELYSVYDVLSQLRIDLSYDEFENLVYDMRHIDYKMIGIMEKDVLVTFAGVAVGTNFYHKRHLFIYDFVTDEKYRAKGYGKMMLDYLKDYAKMAMCENLVLSSSFQKEDAHKFYEKSGFSKKSFVFVKNI